MLSCLGLLLTTDGVDAQLVNADDDEHTPIAGFHPHRRHFFVFRMSKHAFIEIKPVPEIAQDMEKLIGEQQQQPSYSITSLMPLARSLSKLPFGGATAERLQDSYQVGQDMIDRVFRLPPHQCVYIESCNKRKT